MSIKEKAVFKKYEFEYESPDGDKWDITIADSGDRRYIQYHRSFVNGEPVDEIPTTIDAEMLLDVADAYRNITSRLGQSTTFRADRRNLQTPDIVDHRVPACEVIQSKVDETMKKYDDNVKPVESFSPAANTPAIVRDYTQFRSGVTPEEAAEPAPETPEEWSMKQDLSGWKQDVVERKGMRRPVAQGRVGGPRRPAFKKVEAKDII